MDTTPLTFVPSLAGHIGCDLHKCSFYCRQSHCAEQESQIARLTATVEELTQAKLQQSRQLAEARQQLYTQERTGGEGGRGKVGRLEEELRTAQCELEKAREREKQVSGGKKGERRVKLQALRKNSWEIYKTKLLLRCCQEYVHLFSVHVALYIQNCSTAAAEKRGGRRAKWRGSPY